MGELQEQELLGTLSDVKLLSDEEEPAEPEAKETDDVTTADKQQQLRAALADLGFPSLSDNVQSATL